MRLGMGGGDERKRSVRELVETRVDEFVEFLSIAHLGVFAGGFQSVRMCESADGKRGVGELPDEPIHGSEQEVTLRQRENLRRFADEQFAIGAHLVGF